MSEAARRPTFAPYLAGPTDPDSLLARFLDWCAAAGFELYPAQEEALLELYAGRHVVLNTPTGSGKSLVALGVHFRALAEGRTSYYTSPIKALAAEKFFSLCEDFGAANVGMLTGDASINPEAKILCCTAEVLANMALRSGELLEAPYVVMDEFHYYSDVERGWAWQVPLLALPRTRFLLMSATLGDMSGIQKRIEERTGVASAFVSGTVRPVPLEFEYRETPLHETLEELLAGGKWPIYVVQFTQRDCAELAQSATSLPATTREEREAIRAAIGDFRLDTPYGKQIRRFLSFGIGIHHAGLLPKYRLLVEQLAQRGLLKIICGTDTLGVGVNIPIRTVLFAKLAKFDGKKVQILAVRDFQQIAGRAGRKGFDDRGYVLAQAPEQVIEKRLAQKKGKKTGGRKSPPAGRPPGRAEITWSAETFEKLRTRAPETLKSRFKITHGMLLALLQHDAEVDDPGKRNFDSLRDLIAACHDEEGAKKRHLAHAAVLVRSLARAGILELARDTSRPYFWVVVSPNLQFDFSLYHALSLFLVDMVDKLEPESPDYVLDLVSLVEAVLEDPEVVLRRQVDHAKGELIGELKAQGLDYDERMARLEEVRHPQPLADFLHGNFVHFARAHPWVGGQEIRPKSIAREMLESFSSFADYVKKYGLERSEGVLLRYLSQLYRTLDQNVPVRVKNETVWDALSFFRTLIELTDTSLLEEWESLLHPELLVRAKPERERAVEALWVRELIDSRRALAARARSEMHLLVHALSRRDYEEAATLVAVRPDSTWDAGRLEEAMAPFHAEHAALLDTPEARRHEWTRLDPAGERQWEVRQTLLDAEGDQDWGIRARIDLRRVTTVDLPLLELVWIGR
jgi:superfamily II RNA helicase